MKFIPITKELNENKARLQHSELSKIFIRPARIAWHSESLENTDALLENDIYQTLVNESDKICRSVFLSPGSSILLDFGAELCGGIKLITRGVQKGKSGKKACTLRLRFGESINESMAELGEKGTTNDHNARDFKAEVGVLNMPELGNTGFRFVRIDNIDDGTLEICAVCAAAYFRDIEYKGSFRSSDERLNKIFDTAAYTLHLCMQEYLWDGIKRDRIIWIGDMYPEISALCSVFGYDGVVEKSLDAVRDHTAPDGFVNGIITYSAWWLLIHYRWYMQNGRLSYLEKQHARIVETAKLFAKHIEKDGRFSPGEAWDLFDWPSNGNSELRTSGVHAIVKMMFDCAAFLLNELSDSANAAFCREKSNLMSKAVFPDFDYKQISAMNVLAGLRDKKAENERLLSKNGACGISTFLGMFTFAAQSEAGDTEKALENIKGLYGGMLDVGATSFWEDFDPEWTKNAGRIDEFTPDGLDDIHGDRGAYCYVGFRHSLCHGWSSGVCAYMAEYLLGIKILKPGCREIAIEPHPGNLEFIEGSYPTPYGNITVRHEKNPDGTYSTSFTAPECIKITVLSPQK